MAHTYRLEPTASTQGTIQRTRGDATMGNPRQPGARDFLAMLERRGLSVASFDGGTLTVCATHAAEDPAFGRLCAPDAAGYVRSAIATNPQAELMFPNVKAIEIEPCAIRSSVVALERL
jgi:hypothetical protein